MEIYDRLLQFPLFQGMSHNELMQVVAHTKIGFTKSAAGKRIVREGDTCTHLFFLISGTLTAETTADDGSYTVVEQLSAPYILQPERLFGIQQRYTSSFTAATPCHFITIDKQEVAPHPARCRCPLLHPAHPTTCRQQDLPHPHDPSGRRAQLQPSASVTDPQPAAGRRPAHPAPRSHRDTHVGAVTDVAICK